MKHFAANHSGALPKFADYVTLRLAYPDVEIASTVTRPTFAMTIINSAEISLMTLTGQL